MNGISGWFDNECTQQRELWCLGDLHRSWPRDTIESSTDFAPWGSYPNLPHGAASRPLAGMVSPSLGKGAIGF